MVEKSKVRRIKKFLLIILCVFVLSILLCFSHQAYVQQKNYNSAESRYKAARASGDYQEMLLALTDSTYFDKFLTEAGYPHKKEKHSIDEILLSKAEDYQLFLYAPFKNRQYGGSSLVQEFVYRQEKDDRRLDYRYGTEFRFAMDEEQDKIHTDYGSFHSREKVNGEWLLSDSDFTLNRSSDEIEKLTKYELLELFEKLDDYLE